MKDLPEFKPRARPLVEQFAASVLIPRQQPDETALRRLIAYDDGHYRAVFDRSYFVLADDQAQPTKSQWNSLKKKMKRYDRQVFIFKAHGETSCQEDSDEPCYYIDFGFFAH